MLLATIDSRQPAAWLALAVAAATAALLPEATPCGWPAPAVVATLLGAALAVMALGDAGNFREPAGIDAGWLAERVAWPLVGWGAAAALRQHWPLLACGAIGILATAALVAAFVRRGALGADAASAALLAAGGSAVAGWWAESLWAGRLPAEMAAAAVLGLVVFLMVATIRATPALRIHLRRALTAAGMIGALAGMVAWLLLAADRAALDLAASLAWFAALAVPAATLGDGVSHAALWRRLERAAPAAAGGRLRLPPGRTRDGVFAVLTTAALLGWPPLVAAVVSGGDPARSWPAASVVATLSAAAGVLLAVVWLGERARMSPATLQAAAIGGACLALAGALAAGVAGPNCR
jgi:hypothetical protein